MILKERIEVSRPGCDRCPLGKFPEIENVMFLSVAPSEEKGERLQLNAQIENFFSILQRQFRYLRPRKRRPLEKALMLQFDQRFANQTLADSELLSKLPFDDLFTTPDRTRNDGVSQ